MYICNTYLVRMKQKKKNKINFSTKNTIKMNMNIVSNYGEVRNKNHKNIQC